jgi:hypothetical protein
MFLDWSPRNARQVRIYAILAFPALFALLAARNVPPQFPTAASAQPSSIRGTSSIRSISSHDQRPRFDCNGLHWSAPVQAFLPFPPTEISAHLNSASQPFPTLSTKGIHYNRPPPLG